MTQIRIYDSYSQTTTIMNTLLALTTSLATTSFAANVVHYPPSQTDINNITVAFNGTGAPGIFNSSDTPDELYGIYNWCHMPHVRKTEYPCVTEITFCLCKLVHPSITCPADMHQKTTPWNMQRSSIDITSGPLTPTTRSFKRMSNGIAQGAVWCII